jgi:hypothetical protein
MNRSWSGAFVLVCLVLAYPATGSADTGSVAGKWLARAETPQGPLDLTFDLRIEGDRLFISLNAEVDGVPRRRVLSWRRAAMDGEVRRD